MTLRTRPVFREVAVSQHALPAVHRVWQLPVEAAPDALIVRRSCLTLLHITSGAAIAVSSALFANKARTPWAHRNSLRRWRSSSGAPFQPQSQLALASATSGLTDFHDRIKSHPPCLWRVHQISVVPLLVHATVDQDSGFLVLHDRGRQLSRRSCHRDTPSKHPAPPGQLEAIATAPHSGYAILLDWRGA